MVQRRIYHKNLKFTVGTMQISTYGSVGLDDESLSMIAEVPLQANLLGQRSGAGLAGRPGAATADRRHAEQAEARPRCTAATHGQHGPELDHRACCKTSLANDWKGSSPASRPYPRRSSKTQAGSGKCRFRCCEGSPARATIADGGTTQDTARSAGRARRYETAFAWHGRISSQRPATNCLPDAAGGGSRARRRHGVLSRRRASEYG